MCVPNIFSVCVGFFPFYNAFSWIEIVNVKIIKFIIPLIHGEHFWVLFQTNKQTNKLYPNQGQKDILHFFFSKILNSATLNP